MMPLIYAPLMPPRFIYFTPRRAELMMTTAMPSRRRAIYAIYTPSAAIMLMSRAESEPITPPMPPSAEPSAAAKSDAPSADITPSERHYAAAMR